MNRFQIRKEVQRILRDSDYPKEPIDRAINSVIATVNQMGRFKFHQGYQDLTMVAAQKEYTLANFIAEEVIVWKPDTEDEYPILKAPDLIYPYSYGWFISTGDSPIYYTVWGGKIWFDPIPNATAAGNKVRVYGFFKVASLASDSAVPTIPESYHITLLAWGAAAEINPTLVINNTGRQQSLSDAYNLNLQTMIRTEAWEPSISPYIMKDPRWSGIYRMGYVGAVR